MLLYTYTYCNIILIPKIFKRNKDEITKEKMSEADVIVFGGPNEPFTKAEFDELNSWLKSGGRAIIMVGDGGEKLSDCNINYLLEE